MEEVVGRNKEWATQEAGINELTLAQLERLLSTRATGTLTLDTGITKFTKQAVAEKSPRQQLAINCSSKRMEFAACHFGNGASCLRVCMHESLSRHAMPCQRCSQSMSECVNV